MSKVGSTQAAVKTCAAKAPAAKAPAAKSAETKQAGQAKAAAKAADVNAAKGAKAAKVTGASQKNKVAEGDRVPGAGEVKAPDLKLECAPNSKALRNVGAARKELAKLNKIPFHKRSAAQHTFLKNNAVFLKSVDGFPDNTVVTSGGYKIVGEGKQAAFAIYGPKQNFKTKEGKPEVPVSRIWGDPHVQEKDGKFGFKAPVVNGKTLKNNGKWDLTRDATLKLPDGTAIAMKTVNAKLVKAQIGLAKAQEELGDLKNAGTLKPEVRKAKIATKEKEISQYQATIAQTNDNEGKTVTSSLEIVNGGMTTTMSGINAKGHVQVSEIVCAKEDNGTIKGKTHDIFHLRVAKGAKSIEDGQDWFKETNLGEDGKYLDENGGYKMLGKVVGSEMETDAEHLGMNEHFGEKGVKDPKNLTKAEKAEINENRSYNQLIEEPEEKRHVPTGDRVPTEKKVPVTPKPRTGGLKPPPVSQPPRNQPPVSQPPRNCWVPPYYPTNQPPQIPTKHPGCGTKQWGQSLHNLCINININICGGQVPDFLGGNRGSVDGQKNPRGVRGNQQNFANTQFSQMLQNMFQKLVPMLKALMFGNTSGLQGMFNKYPCESSPYQPQTQPQTREPIPYGYPGGLPPIQTGGADPYVPQRPRDPIPFDRPQTRDPIPATEGDRLPEGFATPGINPIAGQNVAPTASGLPRVRIAPRDRLDLRNPLTAQAYANPDFSSLPAQLGAAGNMIRTFEANLAEKYAGQNQLVQKMLLARTV